MVCCAALDLHKFVDCRRENTIAQWRVSRPMMRGKEASMSRMSSTAYSDSATDEHMYAESGPGQTELTISQMSRLYSVSLRTLRFYESRGLMKPRREGSARFYRAADQVRMGMILQGKKLGFTLTEINDLIGGKSTTRRPISSGSCSRIKSSARLVTSNANAMKSTAPSSCSERPTTNYRKA